MRLQSTVYQISPKPSKSRQSPIYGIPSTDEMLSIRHAQGVHIHDSKGRKLIDCSSGTFDHPLGYHHPAITRAMETQIKKLQYSPSPFMAEEFIDLASALVEVTPSNLSKVHLRDLTGSTAVEGAIKIAQAATGKRDVVSLFASHHGQTMFTTGVSGNAFRRELYPTQSVGNIHVPGPNCARCFYKQDPSSCGLLCAERIEDFAEYASSGNIACLIIEPISGNGGNVVPPPGYLAKLRSICNDLGILLIFDEVQTGIGRTGYMTAAERFGVNPDILVLAKGLGGPTPRGAIVTDASLDAMPRSQHSTTGGSGLLSAAVALATLREISRPGFLKHVRDVGTYLGQGLREIGDDFDSVDEVRGLGMMWGLAMVDENGDENPELTNRIASIGPNFGLLLRTSRYGRGNVVKVRPPLILTYRQADEIVAKLRAILNSL